MESVTPRRASKSGGQAAAAADVDGLLVDPLAGHGLVDPLAPQQGFALQRAAPPSAGAEPSPSLRAGSSGPVQRMKWAERTKKAQEQILFDAVFQAGRLVPGVSDEQMEFIFTQAFKRNARVVLGGSRIRGNHHRESDLDVGFDGLSNSQAGDIIKGAQKIHDEAYDGAGLNIEKTKIVTGNETASIPKIQSPEEFFMRSGVRGERDPRAGEEFHASGFLAFGPDGSVVHCTAKGKVTIVEYGLDNLPPPKQLTPEEQQLREEFNLQELHSEFDDYEFFEGGSLDD